jgi:hypothetical protein
MNEEKSLQLSQDTAANAAPAKATTDSGKQVAHGNDGGPKRRPPQKASSHRIDSLPDVPVYESRELIDSVAEHADELLATRDAREHSAVIVKRLGIPGRDVRCPNGRTVRLTAEARVDRIMSHLWSSERRARLTLVANIRWSVSDSEQTRRNCLEDLVREAS